MLTILRFFVGRDPQIDRIDFVDLESMSESAIATYRVEGIPHAELLCGTPQNDNDVKALVQEYFA